MPTRIIRDVFVNEVCVASISVPSNITQLEWDAIAAPYLSTVELEAPLIVTPVGLRRSLKTFDYYNTLLTSLNTADPDILDIWEYGTTFHKNGVLIKFIKTALGLSTAQINSLLIEARNRNDL